MSWQELGVVIIVAGAVLFLVRRFGLTRRTGRTPAQTFVPLSELRKKDARGTPNDRCH